MDVRKVVCRRCWTSLGLYRADWEALGDESDPAEALVPVRLPQGFVEWDGAGDEPLKFFRVEVLGEGPLFDPNPGGLQFRWRCGCGARLQNRARTLAQRARQSGDVIVTG